MKSALRLARIVTTAFTYSTLLFDQIEAIRDADIDLTLIAGDAEPLREVANAQHVSFHCIPMTRQPSLGQDLISLFQLTSYLRQHRFDIIHSTTPKAGLLTALGGPFSRCPIRIHTFTGQRWATLSGSKRWVLRCFDRLIAFSSTVAYADSVSQRDFLVRQRVAQADRLRVLGAGSISGVNLKRFNPSHWAGDARTTTRLELGLPPDAPVIVFVGRVTRDKGIVEIVNAFTLLHPDHPDLRLLLVGPFERDDPIPDKTRTLINEHAAIHVTGFSNTPEKFLGASDIFCLPSYREGFGSVLIEAGAMGLPSVATKIPGLVDAVRDGVTGFLVAPKDALGLATALKKLLTQPDLRRNMGDAARARAVQNFDSRIVNQMVVDEYFQLHRQSL